VARPQKDRLSSKPSAPAIGSPAILPVALWPERTRPRNEELKQNLSITSFSLSVLIVVTDKKLSLEDLHWRQFEELIAELLESDGFEVKRGPGSKDAGVDIYVTKTFPGIGPIATVWQAKKLNRGNKVGIETIRELADTRNEWKASKGIVATTSFLTREARNRVTRDAHTLGKVDGSDLLSWIETYKRRRS
jgi:HJR/Mrr/RecB family endonuclease